MSRPESVTKKKEKRTFSLFKKKKSNIRNNDTSIRPEAIVKKKTRSISPIRRNRRNLIKVSIPIITFVVGLLTGALLIPSILNAMNPPVILGDAEFKHTVSDDCMVVVNEIVDPLNDPGRGVILESNFKDVSFNVNKVMFLYCIGENESLIVDLDDMLEEELTLREVSEELEDRGYDEETSTVYPSTLPKCKILLAGSIMIFTNFISEYLTLPSIDDPYSSGLNINEKIEYSKDKNLIIISSLYIFDFEFTYLTEDFDIQAIHNFPIFGKMIGSISSEESFLDNVAILGNAIILRDELKEWSLTKIYIDYNSFELEIDNIILTYDVDGEEVSYITSGAL